jgi:hypothetical protein
MWKRFRWVWLLAFILLFLTVNRAAFKGYFQADELQNLSWTPQFPLKAFVRGVLTPRFSAHNFRPVGHLYFSLAGRAFGLDFPKYLWTLDALHFLNVWLLWMVMRRLGIRAASAIAGCFFFGLHMALFDDFWKPMYVFDVLCGTFCLLSLLLYERGRWILSFVAFWLAYKSKELAVMLPLVLACYELWFGKRRWMRLIPFAAASLSFIVQAMLVSPNPDSDYSFHFTPAAIATTISFYGARLFLLPYVGFIAILAFIELAATRKLPRPALLGAAMLGLLFVPLLFLPGRLFSAYCYVPFLGLAIVVAMLPLRVLAVGLLLWIPLEVHELRIQRRATLTLDTRVRTWVTSAAQFAKTAGPVDVVVYQGRIPGFADYGIQGAVQYLFHRSTLPVLPWDRADARTLVDQGAPVLVWDQGFDNLTVQRRTPGTRDLPYLEMNGATPVWQLLEGWHDPEANYRWTATDAVARLDRPDGATKFALRIMVVQPVTVRVRLGSSDLAPRQFTGSGWQTAEWELAPAPAGPARIEFHSDTAPLGIAVGAFGFTSR